MCKGLQYAILLGIMLAVSSLPALSQPVVDVSRFPSQQTPALYGFLDGSSNVQYICSAKSVQPVYTWVIGTNLTNIVVSANVATITVPTAAHGLGVDNPIVIVGGPANLAGTYIVASVPTTLTFTISTSGVGDGTYTTAGMKVTTNAPRTSAPIWSIMKMYYTGTNWIRSAYSNGNANSFSAVCDNRATIAYQ